MSTIYFLSASNLLQYNVLLNFAFLLSLLLQFEIDALDVNAVGFIDETSNIIFSGSDNGIIKVKNTVLLIHMHREKIIDSVID